MIGERYKERGRGISLLYFIDMEEVFDQVKWHKLMEISEEKGVDW